MLRCLFGIAIPVVGIVMGFTHGGGRLSSLLHISEFTVVIGFIVGGLIMAYGFSAPWKMFQCALSLNRDQSLERLRTNVMICEGAAKFALYGGFVGCFLGVVITMGGISGDSAMVGEHFGAAMTGLILGAGIAGIIFQPLKFRFLNTLQEREEVQGGKAEVKDEEVVS